MSSEIEQAAQFFSRVCEEHGRQFPLRNIIRETDGYREAADKDRFVEDVREWLAGDAHRRFDEAAAAMAAEGQFGGPDARSSEIELLEEATRLVKAAQEDKSAGD